MKSMIILLFIVFFAAACSDGSAQKNEASPTSSQTVSGQADPKMEYEKKSIISDKVEILVPKSFTIMPEEMAKMKYPSEKRPTLIYSDKEGSVNLAFNYTTSQITDKDIPSFEPQIKKQFENLYPSATWYKDTVLTINNKKVGVLELLTPATDTKIYNLMFFIELEGKLLMSTFNCTENQMEEWKPVANEIMQSLKIK